MKPIYKIAGIVLILFLMLMANVPFLPVQLMPEAQAFFGRGAAFVVGASVGAASSSAHASAAASQQQAAAAQQQAAMSQQQAAAAQQQAAIEKEKAATAQQQAATAQQQAAATVAVSQQQVDIEKEKAAAAQQQAALAQQQAAASGKPLPLGTVVSALPGGCVPTPVKGVEYYYCAGNFYRAMFQGNTLVYVTAQPK
jgi:hypothetical protein